MNTLATHVRIASLAALLLAFSELAIAQVRNERVSIPPAQMAAIEAAGAKVEIDLGESTPQPRSSAEIFTPLTSPIAANTPRSQGREPVKGRASTKGATAAGVSAATPGSDNTRRVEFNRRPIPVALQIGKERLVTFPGPVLLHVQPGLENLVRLQTIGRTVYVTALAPFDSPLRIVAEDLERDSRMYPVDLVARQGTVVAADEIEIHGTAASSPAATGAPGPAPRADTAEAPDMVALTRHASQALYAPTRLLPASAAIRQVPVTLAPVPGLYRGAQLITTPIAAWRSGNLYVTAVRFTNQGAPLELAMDDLRGQWLAATAQHNRLGAKGAESDTTAVYLVCDKPFEACR